ncbi:MAG: ArsR family transcriptional regulator [Candidatus Diapherotrites archaeon]
MTRKKIIFKIGESMKKDIQAVFKNPKQARDGTTTVYLKNWKELLTALTPQRMEMLQKTLDFADKKMDVCELARKTQRKQAAISRDLKILEANGLITKTKKGKNVYPKLNAEEIVIQLS